jgi:hypothetical protein
MSVKYQAGSFKYQEGFARSIFRERVNSDEHFLLVNINKIYQSPDDAAMLAKIDIDQSLAYAKNGQHSSIDHALSAMGYQKYIEED